MDFKVKCEDLPNSNDMLPYKRFYRGAISQLKGNTFVELGVRDGCSARIIIDILGSRKYELYLCDMVHNPYIDELLNDKVKFLEMSAEQAVKKFNYNQIDFLHIDLDPHKYEQTKNIFTLYEPKVRKGGIIIFHDCTPAFPGVYDFVKNNIEPQPEWVVEYCPPESASGLTAPAMAIRI
jgi:hypothetical protein